MKIIAIVMACLLIFFGSPALAAQKVHVIVHVPADTSPSDPIYLAGSSAEVGGWKADGLKLLRQPDGTYASDLHLEAGQTLEFKINRGSWETVEKNADGTERSNRSATIDDSTKTIEVTVDRWSTENSAIPRASTVVGNLELHEIRSKSYEQSRTVRVWLPPNYNTEPASRFAVLYMQDGQNCFDRATSAFGHEWEIDETLTKLIEDKTVPSMIVVGIDNSPTNRVKEFTYEADPGHPEGGGGARYANFLLTEVKPFIDQTYRTMADRDHTLIGGSSLGGLFVLEIAKRHPKTFGGIIAMSPSVWWADESLSKQLEADAGGLLGTRIWIDTGTREAKPTTEATAPDNQHVVNDVRRLDAALSKQGVEHFCYIDSEHAEHNEISWASRFAKAITYVSTRQ